MCLALATVVAVAAYPPPVSAAPAGPSTAAASTAAAGAASAAGTQLASYEPDIYTEGTTIANRVTDGAPATMQNGPTLVNDGPFVVVNTVRAVALDGTDDYVDTPVAVSTVAGFAVSSWVKLDRIDRAATVVAQRGTRVAGLRVGVSSAGKWQFTMPRGDADAAVVDTVTGPAATAGTWTHLAAVYDPAPGTMKLYVNGVASAAVAHTTPWAASNGGLQWGRGFAAGAPAEYVDGTVTEFLAYQEALDARHVSEQVIAPVTARTDRCDAAQWLHAGGPAVRTLAGRVLAGTDFDRRTALYRAGGIYSSELDTASSADDTTYRNAYYAQNGRYDTWEAVIAPYTIWGDEFPTFWDAPNYGEDMRRFLMERNDTTWHNYFVRPPAPKPAQAELDQALAIAARMRAADPWFAPQEYQVKSWSATHVARFLRYGGYPTVAPADGSLEYRTEVESIKLMWAGCETDDPDGTLAPSFFAEPGPLAGVVDTARGEWAAELSAVAAQRNTIVAAETQAVLDMRAAADAMIEAQGQAWIAGQLLKWQKYWLSRPKTDTGYPTAATFTKAKTDITAAQNQVSAQLTKAKTAATSAQNQVTTVNAALTQAAAVAKANGTPIYRGLAYAQQSAQVTKASSAAAQSASKAVETTLNAVKATNADGAAIESLALTQQSALQAEFRRVAAQEAAAQAKAAAQAAADLAANAATAAARAKADRVTAEAAEAVAKKSAADAHAKLLVAQAERDKATAARERASTERAKAASARVTAEQEQSAANSARGRAESSAGTALAKAGEAEDAEYRARVARDEAVEAERNRDATAARARSLEALAAAADGTSDAAAARAAANDAKAAAADAATAATNARAAAKDATAAAVAARAAATEANGAAQRSRAASDGAQAAADTTRSAYLTATAAAADALVAADIAADSAKQAEVQAATAAAAAIDARTNATAAQEHADAATAESARTAAAAYAAAESAYAARDSAADAVTAATEAIAMGTPFEPNDASAGLAVLVGQDSKTAAEQQAAVAQARATEATRAALAAAQAAANAQADAKLAAQAAAAAASDAAAAAQSVLKAQASAKAAAADAAAAQVAAEHCAEYDWQAQVDAMSAKVASYTAESQAKLANDEATDAEKDAGAARTAATEAESDADYARGAATRADNSATQAEDSAANARQYAEESEAAADRAEEQERLDELAARESVIANGPANLPGLTSEEEQYLFASCGQPCVDEYRAALANANLDLLDWVKQNGGQILLDLVGYTDAKNCFTKGDVEGCLWTLVNAVSLALLVGKIPAVATAIVRVGSGVSRFFRECKLAEKTIERLKKVIETARRADTPNVKPGVAAKPPKNVTFPHSKHPKLGSDGKFYLKEGDVNTKIVDPQNMGHEITDIDRIDGGVLWEEKTAVSPQLTVAKMPAWIQKQVVTKLESYVTARQYVAGYEKAPIGLRFTAKGVSSDLRKLVEQEVKKLRGQYPDAGFRLEWAD